MLMERDGRLISNLDMGSRARVRAGQRVLEIPKTSAAWMPRGLLLAIRNSLRQKKRLAITVAAMALGVAIFSTGFNVRASLAALLEEINTSTRHDVQVVLKDQIPRERALPAFPRKRGKELKLPPLHAQRAGEGWGGGV